MIGACIIDGIDITTLGMFIVKGGDTGFVMFPEAKEPEYNDWPEETGLEVDLDNPVFNARKFTVQYYCKGDASNFQNRIDAFYELHYQIGYRSIYIREFDKTFQLRFVGISDYRQKRGFSVIGEKSAYISVDYMMDGPVQFFTSGITNPISARDYLAKVRINNIDLSKFGIIVRDIYATAMKSKPKDPLTIESGYTTGITADVDNPVVKELSNITIECTMLADDLATFWTNYNALWNNLSAGRVVLSLTSAIKDFSCWYMKMQRFIKHRPFNQRVKVDFDLVLATYSDEEILYLLASEDDKLITTEDGFCIDMRF